MNNFNLEDTNVISKLKKQRGNGMSVVFVCRYKIIFCLNRFIRTFVTQVKNPYENNTT